MRRMTRINQCKMKNIKSKTGAENRTGLKEAKYILTANVAKEREWGPGLNHGDTEAQR